jgi:abortive infection bacteriophage resistance protein
MKYKKPPLTFEQQVDLIKSRGFVLRDEVKIIEFLKRVSYYRLSAYFIPFQIENDTYTNVDFESVIDLYKFDCKIRRLLFGIIENIEISLRTDITYYLGHEYGAFGYLG